MQIDHVDHLVLTVQDIQTTCEFYLRVLGMQVVTFAEGRMALSFQEHERRPLGRDGKVTP